MKPIVLSTLLAAALLVSGCEDTSDLDEQIKAHRERVESITAELKELGGNPSKQLAVVVSLKPLSQYLTEISTPGLTIQARGVSASGEVLYKPGKAKVWIQPPHDSKGSVTLSGFTLEAADQAINWTTNLSVGIETRLHFSIMGIKGNVHCSGAVPGAPTVGSMSLAALPDAKVGYTLALAAADRLMAEAGCGLGLLGYQKIRADLRGLATKLPPGSFSIGLAKGGQLKFKQGDTEHVLSYSVATKEPELQVTPAGVLYSSNLDIEVAPAPAAAAQP